MWNRTEKVSAEVFLNLFLETLKSTEQETINKYKDLTRWTEYLADKIEEILRGLNLKTNREYFRIDIIGWSGNKEWDDNSEKGYKQNIGHEKCTKNSDVKLNEYNWNLEVAVEYENNPEDWMDEVIKLCHVKCGLKVVIGYSAYDSAFEEDGTFDDAHHKMHLVLKNIYELEYAGIGENEQMLIILGDVGKDEYKDLESLHFRAYLLSTKDGVVMWERILH